MCCIVFCVKLYPNLCCVVLLCCAEFYLLCYIAFALHLQLHLHITTSRQVGHKASTLCYQKALSAAGVDTSLQLLCQALSLSISAVLLMLSLVYPASRTLLLPMSLQSCPFSIHVMCPTRSLSPRLGDKLLPLITLQ